MFFKKSKTKNIVEETDLQTGETLKILKILSIKELGDSLKNLEKVDGLKVFESKKEDIIGAIPTAIANNLKHLEVINPHNKKDLTWLTKFPHLQTFKIECILKKVALNGLENLRDLRTLKLYHFTNVESFNEIVDKVQSPELLEVLEMEHFTKLVNFAGIQKLANLKVLKFSGVSVGSDPKKVNIESLKPLENLRSLKVLELGSITIEDNDVTPILEYKNLAKLQLAPKIFTQKDYARLSAHYPGLDARCLKPYFEYSYTVNNRNELRYFVIGSGKKLLTKGQDAELQKEIEQFEKYKKEELELIANSK